MPNTKVLGVNESYLVQLRERDVTENADVFAIIMSE